MRRRTRDLLMASMSPQLVARERARSGLNAFGWAVCRPSATGRKFKRADGAFTPRIAHVRDALPGASELWCLIVLMSSSALNL